MSSGGSIGVFVPGYTSSHTGRQYTTKPSSTLCILRCSTALYRGAPRNEPVVIPRCVSVQRDEPVAHVLTVRCHFERTVMFILKYVFNIVA